MKKTLEIHQNAPLKGIPNSPIPRHRQTKKSDRENRNSGRENTPPIDPNVQIDSSFSFPVQKSPSKSETVARLNQISDPKIGSVISSDPSVKVIARIRPLNNQEQKEHQIVKKVSSDSLTIADRIFSFDAVADSRSTQEDIFQLVGIPLVKNSLAGFNSSILSYGQTGSGKTYTMWGPQSAMLEGHSPSSHQGVVPRVFEMLFSEIQKEQENATDKLINYQCRCSFLEIYNEQIDNLLDPTQRNLQIREDAKNNFYIENLTEEYVSSIDDIAHILIKGLSNRRVGATTINSKSSRSHIVLTCVIESWCKGISSKSVSSSKSSRINFVDLAGSERQKLVGADRKGIKERKNVKGSLSQLGNLVNTLAEVAQSGIDKSIPYRNSCLTHLLQESLGGNAKLTVICAISPAQRFKHETLSTLRFGQRAKALPNKPVVNEITEDDVNDLSDQIRQLKEELTRVKSNENNSVGCNVGYFKGRNARDSLNQLRLSLNRSLILPHIENDSEEEMNVDEEDVRELCVQLDNLRASLEGNLKDVSEKMSDQQSFRFAPIEESSDTETANASDGLEEILNNGDGVETVILEQACQEPSTMEEYQPQVSIRTSETSLRDNLQIIPCQVSQVLQDPTLSVSPRFDNNQRKSLISSLNLSESQHQVSVNPKCSPEIPRSSLAQSVKDGNHIRSSLQSSKIFKGQTEALAASLHRGLQIINYHQQNSVLRKSSAGFPFEDSTPKPVQAIDKVDADAQTLPECEPSLGGQTTYFLCAVCKKLKNNGCKQTTDMTQAEEGLKIQEAEEALASAMKREMELENVCTEQAAKIKQLNRLVEQYKNQLEHSSIIEQMEGGNNLRLEGPVDNVILTEEFKNEEYESIKDEQEILKDKYENHPEVLKASHELKDVQKDLDNKFFDLNERESLLEEVQALRNQLLEFQSNKIQSLLLLQSTHLRKSGPIARISYSASQDNKDEEFEQERKRWTETESEWISLTEELRLDLESYRRLAEKREMDLRMEKECKEELDDALQRALTVHARIVEHYADLQEKHNGLLNRYRKIMEGIEQVKRAAEKAGTKKRGGSGFVDSLAAELSALRVEREREREYLKGENRRLRIQLRDTAEAVHAAGELLVRLKEAEEAAAFAEEGRERAKDETEKVKKQMQKLKKKHAMEINTMKHYLAESRLPEFALKPLFRQDSDGADNETVLHEDDQEWRKEFEDSKSGKRFWE